MVADSDVIYYDREMTALLFVYDSRRPLGRNCTYFHADEGFRGFLKEKRLFVSESSLTGVSRYVLFCLYEG